jgi:hypothetical protein
MSAPARFQCPAAAYVRLDRHMVVGDRRWTLTDPAGVETVVCSLACVVTVACRWLPADLEGATDRQATGRGTAA